MIAESFIAVMMKAISTCEKSVGQFLADYSAQHPGRQLFSHPPPWDPDIYTET
jgi:hypothetical protein